MALVGIALGSALTMAYGIRFIWGAFATKKDADGRPACPSRRGPIRPSDSSARPVALAGLTVVAGLAAPLLDTVFVPYADTAPESTPGVAPPAETYHLALWHGLEPALLISLITLLLGVAIFWLTRVDGLGPQAPDAALHGRRTPTTSRSRASTGSRCSPRPSRSAGRCRSTSARSSSCSSRPRRRRSSPGGEWIANLDPWQTPMQLVVAPLMIAAGIFAVRATKRYTGVVLVSVTGVGMVLLFATSGAPDLALTQVLVETVTLVAFALVLRRLPARMGEHNASVWPIARAVLGIGVGVTMAIVAIVATGARVADPISDRFPELAYELGSRPERRQRRPRRPARLGHDGRAVGAHPRRDRAWPRSCS